MLFRSKYAYCTVPTETKLTGAIDIERNGSPFHFGAYGGKHCDAEDPFLDHYYFGVHLRDLKLLGGFVHIHIFTVDGKVKMHLKRPDDIHMLVNIVGVATLDGVKGTQNWMKLLKAHANVTAIVNSGRDFQWNETKDGPRPPEFMMRLKAEMALRFGGAMVEDDDDDGPIRMELAGMPEGSFIEVHAKADVSYPCPSPLGDSMFAAGGLNMKLGDITIVGAELAGEFYCEPAIGFPEWWVRANVDEMTFGGFSLFDITIKVVSVKRDAANNTFIKASAVGTLKIDMGGSSDSLGGTIKLFYDGGTNQWAVSVGFEFISENLNITLDVGTANFCREQGTTIEGKIGVKIGETGGFQGEVTGQKNCGQWCATRGSWEIYANVEHAKFGPVGLRDVVVDLVAYPLVDAAGNDFAAALGAPGRGRGESSHSPRISPSGWPIGASCKRTRDSCGNGSLSASTRLRLCPATSSMSPKLVGASSWPVVALSTLRRTELRGGAERWAPRRT